MLAKSHTIPVDQFSLPLDMRKQQGEKNGNGNNMDQTGKVKSGRGHRRPVEDPVSLSMGIQHRNEGKAPKTRGWGASTQASSTTEQPTTPRLAEEGAAFSRPPHQSILRRLIRLHRSPPVPYPASNPYAVLPDLCLTYLASHNDAQLRKSSGGDNVGLSRVIWKWGGICLSYRPPHFSVFWPYQAL